MSKREQLKQFAWPWGQMIEAFDELQDLLASDMKQADAGSLTFSSSDIEKIPWRFLRLRRTVLGLCQVTGCLLPHEEWQSVQGLYDIWLEKSAELRAVLEERQRDQPTNEQPQAKVIYSSGCLVLIDDRPEMPVYKFYTGGEESISKLEVRDDGALVLFRKRDRDNSDIAQDCQFLGAHRGFLPANTVYLSEDNELLIISQPRVQALQSTHVGKPVRSRLKNAVPTPNDTGVDRSDAMNQWVEGLCGTVMKTWSAATVELSGGGQPLIPMIPRAWSDSAEPVEIQSIITYDVHTWQLGRDKQGSIVCFDRIPHKVVTAEDCMLYPVAKALVTSQKKLDERYPGRFKLANFEQALETFNQHHETIARKHGLDVEHRKQRAFELIRTKIRPRHREKVH